MYVRVNDARKRYVTFQIYFCGCWRQVCVLGYFDYFSFIDSEPCFNKVSVNTDFGVVKDGVDGQ